jgi:hypothetical protein
VSRPTRIVFHVRKLGSGEALPLLRAALRISELLLVHRPALIVCDIRKLRGPQFRFLRLRSWAALGFLFDESLIVERHRENFLRRRSPVSGLLVTLQEPDQVGYHSLIQFNLKIVGLAKLTN